MLKIKDLRKKSDKDLIKQADKLREEVAQTELDKFTKDDKNLKKQRNLRKDLAKVLTVLNDASEEASAKDEKKVEDK